MHDMNLFISLWTGPRVPRGFLMEVYPLYSQIKSNLRELQVKSRYIVYLAKKTGTLKCPCYCEDCGECFIPEMMYAHHEDYTRPLDVEWLCGKCHNTRRHISDMAVFTMLDDPKFLDIVNRYIPTIGN